MKEQIGLNRNQLKYIAIVAMVIDHVGMFFVPTTTIIGVLMRVIGRITGPVMCFFLAEGFHYTSNRKKYGMRLFAFAVISQFAYSWSHHGVLFTWEFSMIYTLFLCFLMLAAYEGIKNPTVKWIAVIALILLSGIGDWGLIGPLFVLMFYIYHDNKKAQLKSYAILVTILIPLVCVALASSGYHWYGNLWMLGCYEVIPLLLLYNGKPGKKSAFNRWFFYLFYPLHLVILGVIGQMIA